VVEGQDIAKVAGVGYPHTSHCLGSGDIMISTMGAPDGKVTPGSTPEAIKSHAVAFKCTTHAVAAAAVGCVALLKTSTRMWQLCSVTSLPFACTATERSSWPRDVGSQ
jgi:hypothetical protein